MKVRTLLRAYGHGILDLSAIEVWRDAIVRLEIRQPFKQAHREVYILTDAERTTETYSNRFAAHVLKQHQASALMRTRGWSYQLQGYFDFQSTPTLPLRRHGLSAQFYLDVPGFDGAVDDSVMSQAGIALYILTDQVRFVDSYGEAVRLDLVPIRVFSEVMRDVDLFVGVSSVGADPNWRDQGDRLGYGAYWQNYSFGDLSATAETRKAVLEGLLARLSIASQAEVAGKFLVVKGKLRTYKIHLGSGNILMEPNDQYLCIVPGRGGDSLNSKLYLPFEGDGTMAIILSKAMLLAEDTAITDPTIVRQIKQH